MDTVCSIDCAIETSKELALCESLAAVINLACSSSSNLYFNCLFWMNVKNNIEIQQSSIKIKILGGVVINEIEANNLVATLFVTGAFESVFVLTGIYYFKNYFHFGGLCGPREILFFSVHSICLTFN